MLRFQLLSKWDILIHLLLLQYLDSGHSMFKVILNYTNICLVPCKNSWSVKSRSRMKMLSCIHLSWLFRRKADIVHSYLGLGCLKVFSFDKSSPVNFLKEIILRITKILRMQRSKDQTRQSSEKFRIFLISCLSQESRVVAVVRCCCCCCSDCDIGDMRDRPRSLVTPSASHDIMTYPRPLIGHCWPVLTSDWSAEVRTDIVTDLNMTQASGRHIFLLPGFRGWARRGPSPHISRDRDQCLASVGGWHSDIIVCVLVWMILLKRTIALIKQT